MSIMTQLLKLCENDKNVKNFENKVNGLKKWRDSNTVQNVKTSAGFRYVIYYKC